MGQAPSTRPNMKKFLALFFALALAVSSFATIKNVTSVSATASTIVTPSSVCRTLTIQNTGSGDVRLGLDGGVPLGLTDPTATTGFLLKAGTFIVLTFPGSGYQPPPIRAILVSGTTTVIAITTDDGRSS